MKHTKKHFVMIFLMVFVWLLSGCALLNPDPVEKANDIYKEEPKEAIKLYEAAIKEDENNLAAYKGLYKVLEREEEYEDLVQVMIDMSETLNGFDEVDEAFKLLDKYCRDIRFQGVAYDELETLAWAIDGNLMDYEDDVDIDDYDELIDLVENIVIDKEMAEVEPPELIEEPEEAVIEVEPEEMGTKISVPDLIGLNFEDAILVCDALGIEYHLDIEETNDYEPDTVIYQSLEPGEVIIVEEQGLTITTAMADITEAMEARYPMTYVGSIYSDDYSVDLPIHLTIDSIADNIYRGTYYYDHVGTNIAFEGDYSVPLQLYEWKEMIDGEITGIFQIYNPGGESIWGHWYTPDFSKKFNVILELEE